MQLIELFEEHPRQKWICSHWGGGLPFFALNRRVAKALRNVWFDSAASPLLYSGDVWKVCLQLIGNEKILFGSDFPLILDPKNSTSPSWDRILSQVIKCQLETSDLERVMWNNIHHLARQRT
jgi:predicted TIM-barrel fold metal-dependent hydrolase